MDTITTTATASTITVIRTTERGAHLITDGVRVAWIQGRSMRADGTLTPSGVTALANGKPYEEWKVEDERRRLWQEDREKARELAFQEGKLPTDISIPADAIREGSEKSWKVRHGKQWLYGKYVNSYEYLPKSVVSVRYEGDKAVLTMPKWFLGKNEWLKNVA